MNKQQLIKYLAIKNEALEFWECMKDLKPGFHNKIALLKSEISQAYDKLKELRENQKNRLE